MLPIAEWREQVSAKHGSVEGTLDRGFGLPKSFLRKDGCAREKPAGRSPTLTPPEGEEHRNSAHERTTDPNARLYRKGESVESKLVAHQACPCGAMAQSVR